MDWEHEELEMPLDEMSKRLTFDGYDFEELVQIARADQWDCSGIENVECAAEFVTGCLEDLQCRSLLPSLFGFGTTAYPADDSRKGVIHLLVEWKGPVFKSWEPHPKDSRVLIRHRKLLQVVEVLAALSQEVFVQEKHQVFADITFDNFERLRRDAVRANYRRLPDARYLVKIASDMAAAILRKEF